MPIVTMPLSEALEKGYEIIGAEEPRRVEPPTAWESTVIIGSEVVPTLLGAFAFGIPGAVGGSAAGNWASQQYRIARGLQEEVGLGELGAATVLGGVPLGKFAQAGLAGRTAIRGAQGAGLATGELLARTHIDEDRAPTKDEIASTLLFGGAFGGAPGAAGGDGGSGAQAGWRSFWRIRAADHRRRGAGTGRAGGGWWRARH